MGDQRQIFRFRLPWLSAASAPPRPIAEPQPRPAPQPQTQAPSQPSTTIPIQRPPFRPAGIAPVQTAPGQAQAPPQKTEPQPAAPFRVGASTEPKANSQPASPPRLTSQVRASSVPPSPSRGTIQTRATSQTQSPTRAPTQARAASVPPPPSRIALEPQSTVQAVSKQQSPPRAGETSSQLSSSPSRRVTQVQPTLSPPKKPPTATQESSQPSSTTFRPFAAVKPSETSAQVKEVAAITAAARETPSAPLKPKERDERKKAAEERRKARTKGSSHEEAEQRTTTKLLAAATDAASETGKRHHEKKEDIEKKKTWTTSSTDEKQIKTVSLTHSKDGSMPNTSHQKHVTSNWEQVPLHKEIREDISKFVHELATGQPNLPTEEKSISVLTLAGENRGAVFHLGSESAKKDGLVHIHRGYKINPDDSPDTTTDGEGSSRGRKPKDSMTKEKPAPRAYVNSNIQSVNNSVVFESSVNERNPGVHLEFEQIFEESTKSRENAQPLDTRKAEFNITPAEKLTYEPTVRRRCLRGLFAEPSDSDPDNPEKPRRHGCRYSCGEKNKEKEIGIF
ncbi:hypothetical protein CCACVL1_08927 [Corchorus capsularis]|uniref:Uncharacterized protein n=1 Tax=Corchorus capsularis TaxID=210143 RepID=A0A1R3IYF4_COCAP|nr:hypothetical protein CCACVL1_08927 [Corchorus capsularis]